MNLYLPAQVALGDPQQAGPWLQHVRNIYPDHVDHLVAWLAHRVQRPQDKINHALVLGGMPGIGKDTLLEPVKAAIGPWNFKEISPSHLFAPFNGCKSESCNQRTATSATSIGMRSTTI